MKLSVPEIKYTEPKQLAGISMQMSFADNKTRELWQAFMPRLSEIKGRIGDSLYSLQVYNESFFKDLTVVKPFTKYALAETDGSDKLPPGMEVFSLPAGLYAVFHYVGSPAEAPNAFIYIFSTWLPQSEYTLEYRPHFEVIGTKYNNASPLSEEEIWIPVKLRK